MTEHVHDITNLPAAPLPPAKPNPTREVEAQADAAIRYLERFVGDSHLDPDLRMALGDIRATIKLMKQTIIQQSTQVELAHERQVELTKSQRLI